MSTANFRNKPLLPKKMHMTRIEKEVIEKLLVDEFTCSICLDVFKQPSGLNCGHLFCSQCLKSWLHERQTCPVCRFNTPSRTIVKYTFLEKLIEEMKSASEANANNAANAVRRHTVNIANYQVPTPQQINVRLNSRRTPNNQRPPWR